MAAAGTDELLTPIKIRQKLLQTGFDADNYSSFLASIHVVVRRLKEKGEIKPVGNVNADGRYKLVSWVDELG